MGQALVLAKAQEWVLEPEWVWAWKLEKILNP